MSWAVEQEPDEVCRCLQQIHTAKGEQHGSSHTYDIMQPVAALHVLPGRSGAGCRGDLADQPPREVEVCQREQEGQGSRGYYGDQQAAGLAALPVAELTACQDHTACRSGSKPWSKNEWRYRAQVGNISDRGHGQVHAEADEAVVLAKSYASHAVCRKHCSLHAAAGPVVMTYTVWHGTPPAAVRQPACKTIGHNTPYLLPSSALLRLTMRVLMGVMRKGAVHFLLS